jgi:seryl-tRNA synthetase
MWRKYHSSEIGKRLYIMQGEKRLEQAFEKLEKWVENSSEISSLSGNDGEKIKNLLSENKKLKEKQKDATKRLDKIISKIEKGQA